MAKRSPERPQRRKQPTKPKVTGSFRLCLDQCLAVESMPDGSLRVEMNGEDGFALSRHAHLQNLIAALQLADDFMLERCQTW